MTTIVLLATYVDTEHATKGNVAMIAIATFHTTSVAFAKMAIASVQQLAMNATRHVVQGVLAGL